MCAHTNDNNSNAGPAKDRGRTEDPTIEVDHPGLIYFIYAALVIANLLLYAMAILLIKPCVKLFSLARGLLLSLIIPVCLIGAYAARLSMVDAWIMLISGLLGYVLLVFRFPLAPIVLGVILAGLLDENLRRALLIFVDRPWGYFFSQYIGNFLLVCIVFVFAEGLWRMRRGFGNGEDGS